MAGRTTEPRAVTVNKTSGSTAVTAAAGTFNKADVGRVITGTGLAAGTTISAVASGAAATLSANATATNSASATIGSVATYESDGQKSGFIGWSPETEAEHESYSVAANNAGTVPPDRVTNPNQPAPSLTRRVKG